MAIEGRLRTIRDTIYGVDANPSTPRIAEFVGMGPAQIRNALNTTSSDLRPFTAEEIYRRGMLVASGAPTAAYDAAVQEDRARDIYRIGFRVTGEEVETVIAFMEPV